MACNIDVAGHVVAQNDNDFFEAWQGCNVVASRFNNDFKLLASLEHGARSGRWFQYLRHAELKRVR